MGLFKNYISQTRKPQGFLGKMMINGMNSGHTKLASWGTSFLTEQVSSDNAKQIAELGCGGGKNISELLKKYPSAKVSAIDYSELSVEKAKEFNQKNIEAGRCTIEQGDVSSINLPQESFDIATAFETIYFWPGLEKCFTEVCKILKTGGTFMIVNESDGKDEISLKFEKMIDGMKCYTPEQIESALKSAGFSSVKTEHHASKPWICVLATK